ncbi:hypothetical protein E0W45_11390 [Neisseria meningitidis]|nr:hypothetical protein [Neisseria meningitidis]MBG8603994.1 hypothetical protein [Neisseria meningitidis]MBG8644625.1 hypothetical protein [Neisseria meningitidis]MBG8709067.1 hypothetical protein [Neisseria meningitidis]MBG8719603.1 hypothetical protein [Neisseria meningitidis]
MTEMCISNFYPLYSELNLNRYSVGSPCRTICTVCGSPPCPNLNLIHYKNRILIGRIRGFLSQMPFRRHFQADYWSTNARSIR